MKNSFCSSEDLSLSLFTSFLTQNEAYDSYMRNCIKVNSPSCFSFLKYLIPESYVHGAFLWENTPEGFDYWKLINDKWKLVLDLFNL